jgi:hypothetical protein
MMARASETRGPDSQVSESAAGTLAVHRAPLIANSTVASGLMGMKVPASGLPTVTG